MAWHEKNTTVFRRARCSGLVAFPLRVDCLGSIASFLVRVPTVTRATLTYRLACYGKRRWMWLQEAESGTLRKSLTALSHARFVFVHGSATIGLAIVPC
jgi:hypothetical protein